MLIFQCGMCSQNFEKSSKLVQRLSKNEENLVQKSTDHRIRAITYRLTVSEAGECGLNMQKKNFFCCCCFFGIVPKLCDGNHFSSNFLTFGKSFDKKFSSSRT